MMQEIILPNKVFEEVIERLHPVNRTSYTSNADKRTRFMLKTEKGDSIYFVCQDPIFIDIGQATS